MKNQPLKPRQASSMSHNVYCGYSFPDHKMLGLCRVMCSTYLSTKTHTSSNPHQVSWSQFKAKQEPQEPFFDTAIGGIALAMLLIAMAFV